MIVSFWRTRRNAGQISSGIRGTRIRRGGMFFILLFLTATGCALRTTGSASSGAPALQEVNFSQDGLDLTLLTPHQLATLNILDVDGKPIQSLPLPAKEKNPHLHFSWQSLTAYQFQLCAPSMGSCTTLLRKSPIRSQLTATLRLPHGQNEIPLRTNGTQLETITVVPAETSFSWSIELHNDGPVSLQYHLSITMMEPATGEHTSTDPRMIMQEHGDLSGTDPTFHFIAPLATVRSGSRLTATLRFSEAHDEELIPQSAQTWSAAARIETLTPTQIRKFITVQDMYYPADAAGKSHFDRPEDTVMFPDPIWKSIRRWFGLAIGESDPYAPSGFHRIHLRNTGTWNCTLVITSRVRDPKTRKVVSEFIPRAFEATGGTGTVTTLAQLPAAADVVAAIPLYVRREVAAGQYQLDFDIRLLGTTDILHTIHYPLVVMRSQPSVSIVLALAMPGSAVVLIVWSLRYRRWLLELNVLGMTTIAALAAFSCLMTLAIDLVGRGLIALFGPFGSLLSGSVHEVVSHFVITILLIQYPIIGSVTLFGLTSYLVRGLTMGQFSPVDILFLTTSLGLRESFLWLLGITHRRENQEAFNGGKPIGWIRLSVALISAGLISTYVSLALHTAFFRVFFATWYIALNVVIAAVFPIPGIMAGFRMGAELRRARE